METKQKDSKKTMALLSTLLVVCMSTFYAYGSGVFTTAAAAQLGGVDQIGLIFALEGVARCVMLPLAAFIANRIGHKKVFIAAVIIYAVSLGASIFSTTTVMYAVWRMLSAVGWGMFVSHAFVVITDIYGQEKAPKYLSIAVTATMVVSVVAAPLTGFVCAVNWKLLFIVGVPVLGIATVLSIIFLTEYKPETDTKHPVDIAGAIGIVLFLAALSILFSYGSIWGWTSVKTLGLGAAALVGLVILFIAEPRAKDPIMPIRLFKNKSLIIFALMLFFQVIAGSVVNYFGPSFIQFQLGFSSTVTGFMNTPGLIAAAIIAPFLGRWVMKSGSYKGVVRLYTIGAVLSGILMMFTGFGKTPLAQLIIFLVAIFPICAVASCQNFISKGYPVKVLDAKDIGPGMALVGLFGNFAAPLSASICGAVYNATQSFSSTFYVTLVCVFIMLVLMFFFKDVKVAPEEGADTHAA